VETFICMRIGVKTYDNAEFAEYFKDKADFLEVMAIVGNDYSFLDDYPLPIVVHVMHNGFGVNFADESLSEKNREAVDFAVELADRFDSEKIILHSGRAKEDACSVENSVREFRNLDKRVIVENCPFDICSTPNKTSRFLLESGRDFCFDVNHAICVAEVLGESYLEMIEEFLKLKPIHFHLSGQALGDNLKDHLSFEDSEVSFENILKMLPEDAEVTLEVTTDIEKTARDLDFIRGLVG